MPKDPVDISGQRFGRLVVISYIKGHYIDRRGRPVSKWMCVCDCGAITYVTTGSLNGSTVSCGCFKAEAVSDRFKKHGSSSGGPEPIPEYEVWKGMISRCCNEKHSAYKNYGGRGILIAKEWREDFSAFLNHIGKRPTDKHTVERIENNGNYEPGNVRWATRKEQRANQRAVTHCRRGHPFSDANTRKLSNGRRQCKECARIRNRIRKRVKRPLPGGSGF